MSATAIADLKTDASRERVTGANGADAPGILGRSALLLHALAWLAVLVTVAVVWVLGPRAEEIYTVQGVGGAAAFALAIWSVVLALRGYLQGEPKRWTVSVCMLFLAELGVLGLWQWSLIVVWGGTTSALFTWGMWTALPVWGVYLCFATMLAAPLARLRLYMAERKRRKENTEAWDTAERRRYAARWYAIYLAVPAMVVLPMLLYVFCAQVIGMAKGVSWQMDVVEWTPDSMKRAANDLASAYDGPRSSSVRVGLVLGGDLPSDCLLNYLHDPQPSSRKYAWEVLRSQYPKEAMDFALHQAPRSVAVLCDTQDWSGRFVAEECDDKTVRALLSDFDSLMPFFRHGLRLGLHLTNRKELKAECDALERERKAK